MKLIEESITSFHRDVDLQVCQVLISRVMTIDPDLLEAPVKRYGGDGGLLGPQNSIVQDME